MIATLLAENGDIITAENGDPITYDDVLLVALLDDNGDILTDEFGNALTAYDEGLFVPIPVTLPLLATTRVDYYSIDLCQDWVRIGECPTGVFTGVLRHLQPGEWRVEGAVNATVIQPGYMLTDVNSVRLMLGEAVHYAGLVLPVGSGSGGLEIAYNGGTERFALSGSDGWAALASRVAYPTPTTGPPWPDSHDVRAGLASTVAAAYVDANLGPSAISDRQYPEASIWDGQDGSFGIWSARLQPLHQLIARICRDGEITCRVSIKTDGRLFVAIGPRRDLTATVVLSDQGDLINVRRRWVPAATTFVLAGGSGQLTERLFRTAGSATGTARYETFEDQTSFDIGNEVQQAANTALTAGAASWSIRAELSDTAAQRVEYLHDYDIGDLVAVEIANVRHSVPVEAVTFDIGPNRQIVRPVLGEAAPDFLSGLLRDITGLSQRFEMSIS